MLRQSITVKCKFSYKVLFMIYVSIQKYVPKDDTEFTKDDIKFTEDDIEFTKDDNELPMMIRIYQ